MNILVIGNGFDIAHGLKTSYPNFLMFSKAFYDLIVEKCVRCEEAYDKTYLRFLKEKTKEYLNCEDDKKFIDELITVLKDNLWICHFQNLQIKDGWVNFEKEISRIIRIIDDGRKTRKILYNRNTGEFDSEIEKMASEAIDAENGNDSETIRYHSLPELKEKLLLDLNRTIRALELYLTYYVEDEQITTLVNQKIELPIIKELNIDKVLSFNYTDTYIKLYGNYSGRNIEYDFIHGKAEKAFDVNTCNLVLGIDEYLDSPEKDSDNEYIEFKKFYQRIYKKTGCRYRKWFGMINNTHNSNPKAKIEDINIYFYGHSLDITDKDIILELITQENAKTTIYYHSRKAFGEQISNLVKILGEKELIERTGDYKPSIIFKAIDENDEFDAINELRRSHIEIKKPAIC